MKYNEPVDHNEWARRLSDVRSPDGFKAYGVETALNELAKGWNFFMFTRDARVLAFTKKRVEALAEESYRHNLRGNLNIRGLAYEDPRRVISRREESHWLNGFTETYKEALADRVSTIIPPEIEDKLDLFCSLVAAMARDAENGHEPGDFGVSLGARKKKEPAKIHPKRDAIIKKARESGLYDAKLRWRWQVEKASPITRPTFISTPFEWELSQEEEALYEKVFEESFMEYVGEEIRKIAPAKAWKNAFLICSLHDEMESQKYEGRMISRERGWYYLKSLREWDYRRTEQRMKKDSEIVAKRYGRPVTADASMGAISLGDFSSHAVQITPGARAAFEATGESPEKFLDRHFSEDFGESPAADLELNRRGARSGGMVMSIYTLASGKRFYIITDDGHKITTLLLPEEY